MDVLEHLINAIQYNLSTSFRPKLKLCFPQQQVLPLQCNVDLMTEDGRFAYVL
jgi:hypothetical protein